MIEVSRKSTLSENQRSISTLHKRSFVQGFRIHLKSPDFVLRNCIAIAIGGRARLSSDVSEIKLVFGIPPERPTPNIAPSWNVAPTDPLPVVRYDAKDRHPKPCIVLQSPLTIE